MSEMGQPEIRPEAAVDPSLVAPGSDLFERNLFISMRGACTADGFDHGEVMYPHEADLVGVSVAKFVCQGCVSKDVCLEYVMNTPEPWRYPGIVAGTTWTERIRILEALGWPRMG